VDIKHGTHVADAESLTVRAAGMLWLATGEENGLERSTRTRNKQHLDLQSPGTLTISSADPRCARSAVFKSHRDAVCIHDHMMICDDQALVGVDDYP